MTVDAPLVPLPPQPAGVPWPTETWPEGAAVPGLEPLVDEAFGASLSTTYAVVVVHGGRLVAERYGGQLEHLDRPAEEVTASTPLLSWSMAKSVLHAAVGILVGDGQLDLEAPAPVAAWADDPRAAITLDDLLCMRDGLDFAEDYVDAERSDVIEMLFASGAGDVAAFAAGRPAVAPPGERFSYSSGTSNIVSGIVASVVGPGDRYDRFLHDRLFGPLGMRTAMPRFDAAGTWIASSFVHCTARDFARFGQLYLRDGVWEGRRLLPEGWVDHGRRLRSWDDEGKGYGAHWWVVEDGLGTFRASGYDGQLIAVVPALDLVVVRLGKTEAARLPLLTSWRERVVEAVARA